MKYVGGKARLAPRITEYLNEALELNKHFHEPFVGGFNLVPHIRTSGRKYCSDVHWALISMYKALKKGWVPPVSLSELEYDAAKLLPETDPLKAFAGFACSFGAKYWGGYARGRHNYAFEGNKNLMRKLSAIKMSYFICREYDVASPVDAVIYCDPPYAGTLGYGRKFNSEAFWSWTQKMATNNDVFVSEYHCPIDAEVLFEQEQNNSLQTNMTTTEKLFKVKP